MSTDVVTLASTDLRLQGAQVTSEQIALVKATVLRPKNRQATNEELALFFGQCQRTGLDPFARQIYGIYRYDSNLHREVMTIQTGIDGFRVTAERTKQYAGQEGPWWQDADGNWHEAWLKTRGFPAAAKVIVKKAVGELLVPTPAVANFDEFAPRKNGALIGLWPQMPAHMIAKCCEALALRKAFPQKLSGIYTDDEMQQADVRETAPVEHPKVVEPVEPLTADDVAELAAICKSGKLTLSAVRMALATCRVAAPEPFNAETAFRLVPRSKCGEVAAALSDAAEADAEVVEPVLSGAEAIGEGL